MREFHLSSPETYEDDDEFGETINTELIIKNDFWQELNGLFGEISKLVHSKKLEAFNLKLESFYGKYDKVSPVFIQQSPLKSKTDSKEIIEELKRSIVAPITPRHRTIEISTTFTNLTDFKSIIIEIDKNLRYHQKESIRFGLIAGEVLNKVKILCRKEKKNMLKFINDLNVNWSKSYISFLISFYEFSKRYRRLKSLTISLYFIHQNFKKIRYLIEDSKDEERMFWLTE
jgi:hypothetical protein